MTRIELVTSPLPRGCSTAKLHGRGTYYAIAWAKAADPPIFISISMAFAIMATSLEVAFLPSGK